MSLSTKITSAVIISWLSRIITIAGNLFLMPILFNSIAREELGLWFLLGNSQAFIGLLGMGFAPTLTRRIALVRTDISDTLTLDHKKSIGELVATGKVVLRYLAVIMFFISFLLGLKLINSIELEEVSRHTIYFSWFLICIGYVTNVYVSYLDCLFIGMGYIASSNFILVIINILTLLGNFFVAKLDGGILALSTVYLFIVLIQRTIFLIYLKLKKPELLNIEGKCNWVLAKEMFKPSIFWWLTSLGQFLILKTDQYFITIFTGAKNIPSYHAAYQLASNLRVLSISFTLSSTSFISKMWKSKKINEVHNIFLKNTKASLALMLIGSCFLFTSGKELTDIWLGKEVFIGYPILITFCFMFIFEVQNVSLIYSARATEFEKYYIPSLVSGLTNIVLTVLLVKPLGLWGVSLGTLISQMLTNNWFSFYKSLPKLQITYKTYISKVIFPCLKWGLFCSISLLLIKLYAYRSMPTINLTFSVITSLIIFTLFMWFNYLEIEQRKLFLSRLFSDK